MLQTHEASRWTAGVNPPQHDSSKSCAGCSLRYLQLCGTSSKHVADSAGESTSAVLAPRVPLLCMILPRFGDIQVYASQDSDCDGNVGCPASASTASVAVTAFAVIQGSPAS